MQTKVLIVDRVYQRSKVDFNKAMDIEFIVVAKDETVVAEEILKQRVSAVVLATDTYVNTLYESLPEGGMIARYGVGHDGVDKHKATQRKQFVTVTPGVLDNSVAEHAVFLMGCLARKMAIQDAAIKNGNWNKSTGLEFKNKTLLVLGCGGIGRRVAEIASLGFGMNVIGYDTAKLDATEMKEKHGFSEMADSLDSALGEADIVSIHLPAIEATLDTVTAGFLAMMRKGSFIINTSRGHVLDEAALYDAIESGHLGGAGLDVFKKEPYEPQDINKDLRKIKNIILAPHLGSSTEAASTKMAESVIKNIRAWANKDYTAMNIVNTDVLK